MRNDERAGHASTERWILVRCVEPYSAHGSTESQRADTDAPPLGCVLKPPLIGAEDTFAAAWTRSPAWLTTARVRCAPSAGLMWRQRAAPLPWPRGPLAGTPNGAAAPRGTIANGRSPCLVAHRLHAAASGGMFLRVVPRRNSRDPETPGSGIWGMGTRSVPGHSVRARPIPYARSRRAAWWIGACRADHGQWDALEPQVGKRPHAHPGRDHEHDEHTRRVESTRRVQRRQWSELAARAVSQSARQPRRWLAWTANESVSV